MSELDRFRQTYFQECAELLADLEERFAEIERDGPHEDAANAVFRAVHSIKGGAGAFGFADLVSFAHVFETLLDEVRSGKRALDPSMVAICIRSVDALSDLVSAAQENRAADLPAVREAKASLDRLLGASAGSDSGHTPQEEFDDIEFTPIAIDEAPEQEANEPRKQTWRIRFRPHPTLFSRANEPLLIFRELASFGELSVLCDASSVPPLDALAPDQAYLSWELTLVGGERDDVEGAFEFAVGDCDLEIEAIVENESAPSQGGFSLTALLDAAMNPAAPEPDAKPLGAIAAPAADLPGTVKAPAATPTIRVDLDRVDRVADMAGELVIAQAMISEQIDDDLRRRYPNLVRGLETLAAHTRALQDAIMAIRAQPVKSVFARMPRLVRELAGQTGKKVRLEMHGESTEIDRTVIEQLADPLTHMIRNSVDHGIESPEKRLSAGKREEGVIRLSAEQVSGRIVIRIEDDGGGINRERVRAKAAAKGLIPTDAELSDEEIDYLIFAPGFSTAEAVSDISGRGVGMDVVRENITRLGGRISIKNNPGQGCAIALTLPLTLAILDVMLVRVAGQPYVLPLSGVIESLRYKDASLGRMPSGEKLVNFRGAYVPVIDLAEMFNATPESEDGGFLVMCDVEGESRIGVVVDAVLGQQQVAIKSIEANYGRIEGFSGATIMGDGRVALILDISGLKRLSAAAVAARVQRAA